jgi:hypothetical protein
MPAAIFFSILLLAAESAPSTILPRPPCTAANAGDFWPDQANKDHKLAAKLARCGELQICSRGFFRFRWDFPTVRVDQLSKNPGTRIPAECSDGQASDGSSSPQR